MANVPTDPPISRTIDYGALVRKLLGDEYHKHEKVYRVSNGRTFESSDYGTQGIYGAVSAVVRSGTAAGGSPSSIILGTEANGDAGDYVGKRITAVDFATTTFTGTIVGYTQSSREARVVPPWGANFVLHTGTAQGGTNTSLALAAAAPTALEGTLSLASGAGSTQERAFTSSAYNGSTKVVNVSKWDAPYLVVGDGSTDEGAQATFYLDFPDLGSGAVDTTPAFGTVSPTFTRATAATTVLSNGLIASVATGVARSYYDPTTLAYLGYLAEGARTNLCLQSEVLGTTWTPGNCTVSANATTAPDGTATADKIVEASDTGQQHVIAQSVLASASTTYTMSFFVKSGERTAFQTQLNSDAGGAFYAIFDITAGTAGAATDLVAGFTNTSSSIKAYQNGWYRCSITGTTPALTTAVVNYSGPAVGSNRTYNGDGSSGLYAWGAQLEAGAFASTYIPTTTAAVTRNADVLTYPTTGWLNAAAGTMFVQYEPGALDTNVYSAFSISDGTTSEEIYLGNISTSRVVVIDGGVLQANISGTTLTVGSSSKLAAVYAENDFAISKDGGTVVTDTSGSMPSGFTTASIGSRASGGNAEGPIRRVAYWPQRLLNTTLQAITDEATDPEFDPSTFPVALPGSTTVYKVEDEAPGVNTTYTISS